MGIEYSHTSVGPEDFEAGEITFRDGWRNQTIHLGNCQQADGAIAAGNGYSGITTYDRAVERREQMARDAEAVVAAAIQIAEAAGASAIMGAMS